MSRIYSPKPLIDKIENILKENSPKLKKALRYAELIGFRVTKRIPLYKSDIRRDKK